MVSIRRLGRGDETTLALLAVEDADFDIPGRGRPLQPLPRDAASAYLADERVLHWIAEEDGRPIGHLLCCLERRQAT
jgi:hypothetical protein